MTIQDVFEAVGAHAAGKITDREVHALESVACPGAGACGGHFTANTMATALDFLGVSAPGLNEVPATHPGKPQAAVKAGELAMKLVVDDTRPSQVLTREAFENAIAAIAATGGSTNGVLHLLAIAARGRHRARRSTTSTRSRRARRSSPTSSPAAATSRPISSRRAASRSSRASSCAAVSSTRRRVGVDGRTLQQVADGAFERPGPGGRRLAGTTR